MRWKQFFTPVSSVDADEARDILAGMPADEVTILDVRQPGEYAQGHIPGARLIPLPQLSDRMNEIPKDSTTLVYCAVGGRSRLAAQMLSGKGFSEILNLTGGFKAWNGETALGPLDQGLELFDGSETLEEVLKVAYSLEMGLREFYLSMQDKVDGDELKGLFARLADIEIHHEQRVLDEYNQVTGSSLTREEFEPQVETRAMEGGLTTEEFTELFQPDWSSSQDILGMAMSIEAQAMDLYIRAADKCTGASRDSLLRIADEEKTHLRLLGEMADKLAEA
jgi:rhodanese-related sulfurtransferase/rubrerythrin